MTVEIKNIINIFKTSTLRQSGVTFTFTLINGLLGMAFYIFLARVLGPSDFGLFSLSIVVLALTADIGNFGANTGIVNFVSKFIKSDSLLAEKYLKIGFLYKVFMGIAVILFGYLLSPFLAGVLFKKPEMIPLLRLAFFGVGSTWLFSFTTSYYQASQKFISWGVIQVFTNAFRFIGAVAVFGLFPPSTSSAMVLYIIAPLLGFLVSLINTPLNYLRAKVERVNVKTFFSFNKWVGISAVGGAASSRADTFVLGRLVTPYGLGLYSAANQLVQVVPQLIGAIGTVVAPKFSSFDNDRKMLAYFKKLQMMVIGIAGMMILSTPIVKLIINTLFGSEYQDSYAIFVILVVAMSVFMVSIPVHNAIIYYYQYPKLFSYLSIINLAIVVALAWVLTKNFGVMGTGYAMLVGNGINFLIPMIWFTKKLNNKQKTISNK